VKVTQFVLKLERFCTRINAKESRHFFVVPTQGTFYRQTRSSLLLLLVATSALATEYPSGHPATRKPGEVGLDEVSLAGMGIGLFVIICAIFCLLLWLLVTALVIRYTVRDARSRGIRATPWVIGELVMGVFVLLPYLLFRPPMIPYPRRRRRSGDPITLNDPGSVRPIPRE
jgi:hypothetical protein